MKNQVIQKTTSKILLLGPAIVSVLVFTSGVTDPVNATKFFALGGFAFALLGSLSLRKTWSLLFYSKQVLALVLFFLLASLNSLFHSHAPLSQQIYGVYGRNNGALLYFFLLLLFIGAFSIDSLDSVKKLLESLTVAGVINLLYCGWVIAFGDFLGWTNPYGNILGTFGNPDFVSAFLGIFSSVVISFALWRCANLKILICALTIYVVTAIEIYRSHAIQGRVLLVFGLVINGFFFIRSRAKSTKWTVLYSFSAVAAGILGVLGTLQIGPLSKLLYKESVSLRGQYWYSGFKMGITHLGSGVGFDTYGDFYRTLRRSSAIVRPGVDTVSNTSHNVFLDIFAFGGLPLIAAYIGLTGLVLISIVKLLRRSRDFDFYFVALVGSWGCFQLQSAISINQVGLAIWGWLLGGAIISYERISRNSLEVSTQTQTKKNQKLVRKKEIFSPQLRAGVGLVVGCLIAIPPLSADMKWRTAQNSRDAHQIENVLKPSYLNPVNSFKYLDIVGAFAQSNLPDLAHKYALEAVGFNPHNYESWRLFTLIGGVNDSEKQTALVKMHQLDPLNPNIASKK